MDYRDPYCYDNIPGTEVPLDHMDYGYVTSCTDLKELGQILKILRSGKEGHYPQLIACTEKRIAELEPGSKLLIKNKPATRMADLPQEEVEALKEDLESWTKSVGNAAKSPDQQDDESSLPPIRKNTVIDQTNVAQTTPTVKEERIKSSDYDSWSKFNAEKEAAKVDKEPQPQPTSMDKPQISSQLSEKERGLSNAEKERMGNKEREKGNEAFRAQDYNEAFVYYTRSISFNPSVAAFNNRAITELKLKRFEDAVRDCSEALKIEPSNTKALFRRGTAYSCLNKLHQSVTDFERVLHFEPNNKKAQQELNAVRKKLPESGGQKDKKKTGHRMRIEEVESDVTTPTESPAAGGPPPVSIATPTMPPPQAKPATPPQAKPATPPLPHRIQALKDEGNQLFKDGQYPAAKDKYTKAINLLETGDKAHEPNVAMLLSNRAACELKIGDCQSCISDCTRSLSITVLNVKAFMRRAKAYEHLEKYKLAYNDYQLALSIDRSLTPAYEASSRITRLLRELKGNGWRDRLPVCPEAQRVRQELLSVQEDSSADSALNPVDSAKSSQEDSTKSLQEKSSADLAMTSPKEGLAHTSEPLVTTEADGASNDVGQNIELASDTKPSPRPIDMTSEPSEINSNCAKKAPEVSEVTSEPTGVASKPSETTSVATHESVESTFEPTSESTGVTSEPAGVTSELTRVTSGPSKATSEPSGVTSEPTGVTSEPSITSPELPINTAPLSETQVTQSTAPVSSPRTVTTPPPKVKDDHLSPEEKFDKHKAKGNEHMKKGEYVEALRYYNMCVSVGAGNVVGYTNRALCHLKLNSPRNAEEDCNKALSIEPGNVKALYRRGLARKALKRYSEAVKDLHLLLSIDSDNASAKRELGEAKQLWEKQLREIQANAPSKDARSERRNPKSKSGKKSREAQRPAGKEGPQKPPPTKEDLEKFQKLLAELEASKEKIEQLSKMGPPGTSWKDGVDGPGGLPFTGPPHASQGKVPNGGKASSGAKKSTGKTNGGKSPSGTGNPPSKSKKKVPKKPPKVTAKSPPLDTRSETKGQSSPTPSKGKRIVIEEINSSDDESPDVTTPPTPDVTTPPTPDVITPPAVDGQAAPKAGSNRGRDSPPTLCTPFEFVQHWNAIPRTAKSSEYARLLEAIPPSTLPSVITNKLDDRMLTNIIRAVDKQFMTKGKYDLSAQILTNLSRVPRFGVVAMFMGPQEKSDLQNVLTKLSSGGHVPMETIANIRQHYGL